MPVTELFGTGPVTSSGSFQDYFIRPGNALLSDTTAFMFGTTFNGDLTVGGSVYASSIAITSDSGAFGNSVTVLESGAVTGESGIQFTDNTNSVLLNNGNIVGNSFFGVSVSGSGTISNNGTLFGEQQGIRATSLDGDDHDILNTGTISSGATGVSIHAFDDTISNTTLMNTGVISGGDTGIRTEAVDDVFLEPIEGRLIVSLTNLGTISGSTFALEGSSAVERVYNEGHMSGLVSLGAADDFFDSRSGTVFGGISLGDGNDVGIGSREADTISAGSGNDTVRGAAGDDTVTGGTGSDVLRGAGGDDDLRGEDDDDFVYGGTGDDVIRGNTGNDQLFGGTGDDNVAGGSGNDEINGGRGDDRLTGNSGSDTFVFNASAGNDLITDFRVNLDVIDLTAFGTRFNRVDAATEVVAGNAIIDLDMLGGDGTLVVRGVGGNLDANDFLF